MAAQARQIWQDWEDEFGLELISQDGAIVLADDVEDRVEQLRKFSVVAARTLRANELQEMNPLLAEHHGPAMIDEAGGAIRTRSAIDALSSFLRTTLIQESVVALRPTQHESVLIYTGTAQREYQHVVVCAGRNTAYLARGIGLVLPVQLSVHTRATYRVTGPPPQRLPTLQDSSGAFGESGIYASPYPGNTHFSIGLSESLPVSNEGTWDNTTTLDAFVARTNRYAAAALPGLHTGPEGHVQCWVTKLPWGDDAFASWSIDSATFLAGHNIFKLAPAIGRVLADSVVSSRPSTQLHPSARLGSTTSAEPGQG